MKADLIRPCALPQPPWPLGADRKADIGREEVQAGDACVEELEPVHPLVVRRAQAPKRRPMPYL